MAQISNSPPQLALRLEARKSFSVPLLVRDAAGAAVDLTGGSVVFSFVTTPYITPTQVYTVDDTQVVAATLTDAAGGAAVVDLQASDLDLTPGFYPYAITLLTADGFSLVLVKGLIELQQNSEFAAVGSTYTNGGTLEPVLAILQGPQTLTFIVP